MKKLFIGLMIISMLGIGSFALADCTVNISWTPSTDPNAALQEVWYDPDTTVQGNEVIVQSGDNTLAAISPPLVIPGPAANDEVWIRTKNADGTDMADSTHVMVGGMSGATNITIMTVCQ